MATSSFLTSGFFQTLPSKVIDRAKEVDRLFKIKRPETSLNSTLIIQACIAIACQENNLSLPEPPSRSLSNAISSIRKTCALSHVPKLTPFLIKMGWTYVDVQEIRSWVQSILQQRQTEIINPEDQFQWEVVATYVLYGQKQPHSKRSCIETLGIHPRMFDAMVDELKARQDLLQSSRTRSSSSSSSSLLQSSTLSSFRDSKRQLTIEKKEKKKSVGVKKRNESKDQTQKKEKEQENEDEEEMSSDEDKQENEKQLNTRPFSKFKFCKLLPSLDPRSSTSVQSYLQWEKAFLSSQHILPLLSHQS